MQTDSNPTGLQHGQVVLVTGSATGIGRHIALALARDGHRVYALMREMDGRNREKANASHGACSDRIRVIELDVTDDDSAHRCVESIIRETGRLDVLVNNAGIMYQGVTEAYDMTDARAQMETNFFGVVRMNRQVLPVLRAQRHGMLVHITSIAVSVVFPYAGLYLASEMAVEGLAESYRYELQQFGIDAIVVQPCPYPSELLDSRREPTDAQRLSGYGPHAHIAEQRIAATKAWHKTASAPDAAEVGALVAQLVAMPVGKRPFRSVAGRMDFGTKSVALARKHAQGKLKKAFGYSS